MTSDVTRRVQPDLRRRITATHDRRGTGWSAWAGSAPGWEVGVTEVGWLGVGVVVADLPELPLLETAPQALSGGEEASK